MADRSGARVASLKRLPDGTVRQVSPLTGTVVWTVPGRSHRPLPEHGVHRRPLAGSDQDTRCAFCPGRYLETPPEKARLVLDDARAPGRTSGAGGAGGAEHGPTAEPWRIRHDLRAEQLGDTVAAFRRIPNLFPILPYEYWHANHGYALPHEATARARDYVSTPGGRVHVLGIMRALIRAAGSAPEQIADTPEDRLLADSVRLFAGTHDLVVARRHFVEGATHDDQLASSGDLTPLEHHAFLALTVEAMRDLSSHPHARNVVVYQNWLVEAGASFDHLHKQLVAIDEHGPQLARELAMLREVPDLFTAAIADPAARDRLVIAENDHAIALAGVGHRYPTVEVYSTSRANRPWEHDAAALRAVSDVLHACHAATGPLIPTNEEWHYRPIDADVAMPWRINLKWRVSTLAGFEGGTRIHLNTLSPFTLRERMVGALLGLRGAGRIGPMVIGDECSHRLGALGYAKP